MIKNICSSKESFNLKDINQAIIKLYDIYIEGHTDIITAIAMSHNNQFIVSGSIDCTVRIWHIKEKRQIKMINFGDKYIQSLIITTDDKYIIIGCKDAICICNIFKETNNIKIIPQSFSINQMILSNTGNFFATCQGDSMIRLWEITNTHSILDKRHLSGHDNEVICIALSSNDIFLASGSLDKTVIIWNVNTKTKEFRIVKKYPIKCIIFSKYDIYIIFSYHELIEVWNFNNHAQEYVIKHYQSHIRSLSVTFHSNNIIYSCSDNTYQIWDIKKNSRVFLEDKISIDCLSLSNDYNKRIYGLSDHSLNYSGLMNNHKFTFPGHNLKISCVVFIEKYNYMITASYDSTIRIWHLINKNQVAVLKEHKHAINCIELSNNEEFFVTGSKDYTVRIWNVKNNTQEHVFNDFTRSVNYIKITRDMKHIISASLDNSVRVYNVNEKTQKFFVLHKKGLKSIDITNNEKYIISTDCSGVARVSKISL